MAVTVKQAGSHLRSIEDDIDRNYYLPNADEDVKEEYIKALQMGSDALSLLEKIRDHIMPTEHEETASMVQAYYDIALLLQENEEC